LVHEQTRVGIPIGSDTRLLLYRNIGMTPDEETLVYRYRLATFIAIASVLFPLVYLSGFASRLILRKTEPELARPYKAWWYLWSTLLVVLASTAFLLGSVVGDLKHILFTAILILLSYLASILIVREKSHKQA
jgi:amino acid transporter